MDCIKLSYVINISIIYFDYVLFICFVIFLCDDSLLVCYLCLDSVMISNVVFVRAYGYVNDYGESHDKGCENIML